MKDRRETKYFRVKKKARISTSEFRDEVNKAADILWTVSDRLMPTNPKRLDGTWKTWRQQAMENERVIKRHLSLVNSALNKLEQALNDYDDEVAPNA